MAAGDTPPAYPNCPTRGLSKVWGDAFRRSGEGFGEAAVKTRIDAIVKHLESLQAT